MLIWVVPDAMPQFRKKYGEELPDGTYQISAPWQAGLSNGAVVGEIVSDELFYSQNRTD
jgi:hypothetical protein